MNGLVSNFTFLNKGFTNIWLDFFRNTFMKSSQGLPEIILILSLICTIGGRCNSFYLSVSCGCILLMPPERIKKSSNNRKLDFFSKFIPLYQDFQSNESNSNLPLRRDHVDLIHILHLC